MRNCFLKTALLFSVVALLFSCSNDNSKEINHLEKLRTEKFAVPSGITITEERKDQLSFSTPNDESQSDPIVLKKNLKQKASRTKSDFNASNNYEGTRIGVMIGSTHDQFVTETYPKAVVIRFDNSPDLAVALKAHQCDLVLMDANTAKLYIKDDPSLTIYKHHVFQEPMGFGFNDPSLRDQFNIFLSDLKKSGGIDSLVDKWKNDDGSAEIADMTRDDFNEILYVGTTNDLPFSYVKNQKEVGLDIEIAYRFAAAQKKKIEFVNIPFASLMPLLKSNKVNMICAGIAITEERKKQVHFSDVYFTSESDFMTLKENIEDEFFTSIDDLKGKSIAVLLGSTQDIYATKNLSESKILRLDDVPGVITSLLSRKSDAALMDDEQSYFFLKKYPEFGYLQKKLYCDSIAVGFPKNDMVMVQKFNDFLKRIKETGLYQEIYDRWLFTEEQNDMPIIENSGKNGTLTIGTEGQTVPFSFLKNGEIVGFDIELLYRFAADLQMKPVLYTCNFSGLIPALSAGKVDVIANYIMVTEERKKEVNFSVGYCDKTTGIICDKKYLKKHLSINDGSNIAESSIAVMTGSLAEMYLKEHYKTANIQCFDDIMDAVAVLKSHKTDYVMTAYTTASTVTNKNSDLKVLPTEYTHEGAGIGFPKNSSSDLLERVNVVIKELKADGTLDQMIERWVKHSGEKYEMPNLPKVEDGVVLKVGCAANREPMCFIQDHKIVGLDCELIERIAGKLGMKVEYVDMKFSALIAALQSNKIDVAISNFTATEERKEKVDFSDIYFVNPQVLMTRSADNEQFAEADKIGWWNNLKESFYNNIVHEKRYLLIWDGLKVTCLISLLSAILGTLLGGLICFMRMSKNILLQTIAKVYIDLLRGIPQVVLLMIMFYVVFASSNVTGVTVASITFAMNFAAYVSEMFRTSIQSVGKGQTEAGIAMGFSKIKTFINIIMPQAIQKVLPVYKGEFIALVKMTSIVGYIAVQDLTKASDIIRSRTFDAFFPLIMVAVLYFVLAWILTQLLTLVEVKTAPKRNKNK